ncbi:MAG: RNA polymerase sigma factor [Coprobacillaceae bacterium]
MYDKLFYFCYMMIGNESDAMDVSQEAIITIYNKIDTLKEASAFKSWMYRLTRNTCNLHFRKMNRKYEIFETSDEIQEMMENSLMEENIEYLPEKAYTKKEIKEIITRFVNYLPTRQREVVLLFYFEGFKIPEIAEILNCSQGNVKVQLHSGRKKLRQWLQTYIDKNNMKIYDYASLPALAVLFLLHKQDITNHILLKPYSKSTIKKHRFLRIVNPIHVIVIITTITCIITVLVYQILNNNINNSQALSVTDNFSKEKDGPFEHIGDIRYDQRPTRESVEVSVELLTYKKDDDITIYYHGESIPYEIQDNTLIFYAITNGNYKIDINKEEKNVSITSIDPFVPIIEEVRIYKDYIQLFVQDEYNRIDYKKSYIVWNNQEYSITKDLKINGQFSGEIDIVLIDINSLVIEYDLSIPPHN